MVVASPKRLRAPDFAKRLTEICDSHPLIPPYNYGRATELRRLLRERYDLDVTNETVRKWFTGESKPRADKLKRLAELLDVDEVWLSMGKAPDMNPRAQRLRDAAIDGSVNIVAGLIQMDGGFPSFPDPEDPSAQAGYVDLKAIIKGASYVFHVTLARTADDSFKFSVPNKHAHAVQIGVIYGEEFKITLVEISEDLIEQGDRKGGMIEVTMKAQDIEAHRIRTFTKRL